MHGIFKEGSAGDRCERCQAVVIEPGLCHVCLLRDGLDGTGSVDVAARQPSSGSTTFLLDRKERRILEDAPLVEGYQLLTEIGSGGMGVVYLADQLRPLRRRVALKLIKLGMDTRQVIARFEAERQALALMDHPSVAKVLDAGTAFSGRPYFVMEVVRGPRITDYCDQFHLSMRERLELFLHVCRAIHHAHQKGIIHRDIKPSNILVTQQDGAAVPKVIDFGIAKATGGILLTEKTICTGPEQFVGTPAYTSPEQAEGGGDIDTRTDIYSLGVLLYELLTGQPPFNSNELLCSGWDLMRRTIRETEPQRPSTFLTSLKPDQLGKLARLRRTDPPRLVNALRGDLDWVVMKCLEKDRARRYDSCSGLAEDIQRHLHTEPVAARPPSNVYRFQKLVRRHKVKLAVAGVVASTLLAATGLGTWSVLRSMEAQRTIDFFRSSQVLRTALPTNQPTAVPSHLLPGDEGGLESVASTLQGRIAARKVPAGSLSSTNLPGLEEINTVSSLTNHDPASLIATVPEIASNVVASPVVSPVGLGPTYAQLAAAFWEWIMEMPLTNSFGAVHPNFDTPFYDLSAGQPSEVWFLPAPFGRVRRSIVVPPNTYLFFPLLNVEASSLEPLFFGRTAQDQAAVARYFANHIVDLFCEIDGVPIPNLSSYRLLSPQITFTAPTPWIFGTVGGTGTSTGDGYYLLVEPLGPGQHTIHFGGAFLFRTPADPFNDFYPLDMTYFISIP